MRMGTGNMYIIVAIRLSCYLVGLSLCFSYMDDFVEFGMLVRLEYMDDL
jgi:hypothetical protein